MKTKYFIFFCVITFSATYLFTSCSLPVRESTIISNNKKHIISDLEKLKKDSVNWLLIDLKKGFSICDSLHSYLENEDDHYILIIYNKKTKWWLFEDEEANRLFLFNIERNGKDFEIIPQKSFQKNEKTTDMVRIGKRYVQYMNVSRLKKLIPKISTIICIEGKKSIFYFDKLKYTELELLRIIDNSEKRITIEGCPIEDINSIKCTNNSLK